MFEIKKMSIILTILTNYTYKLFHGNKFPLIKGTLTVIEEKNYPTVRLHYNNN